MKKVKVFGSDYNEVALKCGGVIYVEPFDDHEEEERCKFYDENMNYIDYIDVTGEELLAGARYDEVIKYFEELEDIHNYLGAVLRSYSYGSTLEDLIDNICQDNVLYYTPEELEEEKQQMLNFLELNGEAHFCAEYLINKIGGIYVYGED
jgi:hypothetical protein